MKEIEEKIDKIGEALAMLIEDVKNLKEALSEKEFCSTITGFESEEDFEKFRNILSDIGLKDESVKWAANHEEKEVYLYSKSKDELHKKSLWLIHKTGIKGLKYKID